ncbi:methyltransferase domain protein [Rhizoctonia solani]|uniref:Methyltransferase domain protein n=1 Tax=Rhizoctonia solani TaxID=456999 RepID=A0A8H8P8P3_9AGAM|nr:methyltransferase domain protein [Rhizoctonia solani]QRW26838.1 methyltransferase domain protein [Rhizoctonia solani]
MSQASFHSHAHTESSTGYHTHGHHAHGHHATGGLKEANRQYFDGLAHSHEGGYENIPIAQPMADKACAAILEAFSFDKSQTVVMDFACGVGLISERLSPHSKSIIGVDISSKSADFYNERAAKQGVPPDQMKAICVDLTERSKAEEDVFGGIEFDVIVCSAAYHHFDDINQMTKVLASYLKPGTGVLIVIDIKESPEAANSLSSHNSHPNEGGVKEANRQYFDSQAHHHSGGYEASPARQLATQKAAATILEAVSFDEDKTIVMDYACGTGLLSQQLAPHTKTLIGVDISPKSVEYYNERVANQGIPPEEMRAICTELVERNTSDTDPFDGVEFDVIVCTQAYHHFDDIDDVTKTLASYLKPGTGVLVVVDMIRSSESEKLHKDHGKCFGIYRKSGLNSALSK